MALNIEKMRKLKEWILAEPRRYYQEDWIVFIEDQEWGEQTPPCGTAACLAGSACLMEGWKPIKDDSHFNNTAYVQKPGEEPRPVKQVAMEILGLEYSNRYDNIVDLFSGRAIGWSDENQEAYNQATTPLGRALAAANEIDRLIQKELDRLAASVVE
jgi:hypothetical protein